jgi:DNA-binding NarL/FixJ family response regulator
MGAAMRCLIVDDSQSFRSAALDMLERAGIAVVGLASNSADGLRCYRDLRPDVTLVDVDLGDESGFDLVEQLCACGESQALPVILISAHAEQDLAELIADSAAVGFLSKIALSPRAIVELVNRHHSGDEAGNQQVSAPPER